MVATVLMDLGPDSRGFHAQLELLAAECSQYAWRSSLPHVSDTREQRAAKKAHLTSLFEVGDRHGFVEVEGLACSSAMAADAATCCLEMDRPRCVGSGWHLNSLNCTHDMPAPKAVHKQL